MLYYQRCPAASLGPRACSREAGGQLRLGRAAAHHAHHAHHAAWQVVAIISIVIIITIIISSSSSSMIMIMIMIIMISSSSSNSSYDVVSHYVFRQSRLNTCLKLGVGGPHAASGIQHLDQQMS